MNFEKYFNLYKCLWQINKKNPIIRKNYVFKKFFSFFRKQILKSHNVYDNSAKIKKVNTLFLDISK